LLLISCCHPDRSAPAGGAQRRDLLLLCKSDPYHCAARTTRPAKPKNPANPAKLYDRKLTGTPKRTPIASRLFV
jgi:hypothetical protein